MIARNRDINGTDGGDSILLSKLGKLLTEVMDGRGFFLRWGEADKNNKNDPQHQNGRETGRRLFLWGRAQAIKGRPADRALLHPGHIAGPELYMEFN